MFNKNTRKQSLLTFFLVPTRQKLIFLAEWVLFVFIMTLQGKLITIQMVLIACYPLLLFYLIACIFTALKQKFHVSASLWKLLTLIVCLVVIDQGIKVLIENLVPFQSYLTIFTDWFHLAHERNEQGAWIISLFSMKSIPIISVLLKLLMVVFLLLAIPAYQLYVAAQRRSLWADIAFIGMVAGLSSWIYDISLRGYILDYIQLPGLVTADLKDIYAYIGAAAFFVEAIDNHMISLKWDGWHEEKDRLYKLAKGLMAYSLQDIRKICKVITKTGRVKR